MPALLFRQRHRDVRMPGLHAWYVHDRGGSVVLHQLPGGDVREQHSIHQGMHFLPPRVVCQLGCCVKLHFVRGWVLLQLQWQHRMPAMPGWHILFRHRIHHMYVMLKGNLRGPGWDGFMRALSCRQVCLVCGEHIVQRLLPGLLCPRRRDGELPGLCIWKLQRRVWGQLLHDMSCRLALSLARVQQLLRGLRIREVCINGRKWAVHCVLVPLRGGASLRVSGMHSLHGQEVLAVQEEGLRPRHHQQRDVVPFFWIL